MINEKISIINKKILIIINKIAKYINSCKYFNAASIQDFFSIGGPLFTSVAIYKFPFVHTPPHWKVAYNNKLVLYLLLLW